MWYDARMALPRGIAKSRKGSLPISIAKLTGYVPRKKLAAALKLASVTLEEAEDAASTLQKAKGRVARFRDVAIAGSVLNPLARGLGRAAEAAAVSKKGRRLSHAWKALKHTDRGEFARHVVEGGIAGAAVKAVPEHMEYSRAKKKARQFLDEKEGVASAVRRNSNHLAAALRPVPTSKLQPIVDNDFDIEV